MPPLAVQLPTLRVAARQGGLELLLRGFLSLSLPEQVTTIRDSTGLLHAIADQHLWVARTGLCHLNITFLVQGEPVTNVERMEQAAQWIQACDVGGKTLTQGS